MCAADAFNEVEGSVTCDKYGQYMLYNQTTKNCFCLTTFILQPDDTCSCKTGETLMGTTCQSCETAKWKAETGPRLDLQQLVHLPIEPEFWRTKSRSTDIRECPVPEACVGGNGMNYCCVGHDGPYCNLCVDGWTMDPLMLCKSCKNSSTDTAITLVVLAVGAALLLVFTS
ncbi:hypothetical protein TrLO_g10635 [Triparma laevis f. longispina]|uniref:Laminin EGF-like domain-containing protein n=1 Tax=Triparma laevis f. longispina TaxID=1714387 RepID=A0A9W7C9F4_9STRA|nr:hypothetical protein TrLO_g10635 [Triparma laevis f. longispina]